MARLTEKQKRFCEEYLVDLNGTQAAIRAGYSARTAEVQASRLLRNAKVQEYLNKLKEKSAKKLEITRERVLTEYARIAFSDIRKFYDDNGRLLLPSELDDDAAAALAGIEVYEEFGFDKSGDKSHIGDTKKIKTYNKAQALDSLGKHLGLFEEDNKQRVGEIDLSALSTEEKYQYLMLRQKAKLNAGAPGG